MEQHTGDSAQKQLKWIVIKTETCTIGCWLKMFVRLFLEFKLVPDEEMHRQFTHKDRDNNKKTHGMQVFPKSLMFTLHRVLFPRSTFGFSLSLSFLCRTLHCLPAWCLSWGGLACFETVPSASLEELRYDSKNWQSDAGEKNNNYFGCNGSSPNRTFWAKMRHRGSSLLHIRGTSGRD